MKYQLVHELQLEPHSCLVLGLFEDEQHTQLEVLNTEHSTLLNRLFIKLKGFKESIWQGDFQNSSLMLIHCGKKADFTAEQLMKCLNEISSNLLKQNLTSATIYLPKLADQDANWQITQMVLHFDSAFYQMLDFKTKANEPLRIENLKFILNGAGNEALHYGVILADAMRYTRRLADLPANICTPTFLAEQAVILAEKHALEVNILGPEEIKAQKMNAFWAVAQGSQEPPRFIELHYRGNTEKAPVVVVGKGITFDSGGLSIKPANCMDEMKYDMAGAATVLGIIQACATLKLPLHVIGLIPTTENMPSGSAVKPGDVVTSLSGQTIEILNTDAEGRLALADALTYAERFQPQWVIDLATLTGAMVVALGHVYTGFMTPDADLAKEIINASLLIDDKVWQFPLDDAYQEALESPIADMINASCTDRSAGSITAACFLSRFTKAYRWAHLDIAGTAWVSGKKDERPDDLYP